MCAGARASAREAGGPPVRLLPRLIRVLLRYTLCAVSMVHGARCSHGIRVTVRHATLVRLARRCPESILRPPAPTGRCASGLSFSGLNRLSSISPRVRARLHSRAKRMRTPVHGIALTDGQLASALRSVGRWAFRPPAPLHASVGASKRARRAMVRAVDALATGTSTRASRRPPHTWPKPLRWSPGAPRPLCARPLSRRAHGTRRRANVLKTCCMVCSACCM